MTEKITLMQCITCRRQLESARDASGADPQACVECRATETFVPGIGIPLARAPVIDAAGTPFCNVDCPKLSKYSGVCSVTGTHVLVGSACEPEVREMAALIRVLDGNVKVEQVERLRLAQLGVDAREELIKVTHQMEHHRDECRARIRLAEEVRDAARETSARDLKARRAMKAHLHRALDMIIDIHKITATICTPPGVA